MDHNISSLLEDPVVAAPLDTLAARRLIHCRAVALGLLTGKTAGHREHTAIATRDAVPADPWYTAQSRGRASACTNP